MKNIWPWLSAILLWGIVTLMLLGSAYCALCILQAGSIYTGERALFNLRYWGAFLVAGLIGASVFGIIAIRVTRAAVRHHRAAA